MKNSHYVLIHTLNQRFLKVLCKHKITYLKTSFCQSHRIASSGLRKCYCLQLYMTELFYMALVMICALVDVEALTSS